MKRLLNVFACATGGGYDTPNITNTVSSSLMSHAIIFIAFLKIMYYMVFFHRKLFPETISASVIFLRISTSLHCFGALFNRHLHGDDHKMLQCWDHGTASRYDAANSKEQSYTLDTGHENRSTKMGGEL